MPTPHRQWFEKMLTDTVRDEPKHAQTPNDDDDLFLFNSAQASRFEASFSSFFQRRYYSQLPLATQQSN